MKQDRGPLRVKKRGQGPAVVLLHGLFGNADTLGGISRYLAPEWTVYSLDLPGHGETPALSELNLTGMAQAVIDTLDAEELHSAHFIGHSLGGKVLMQIAANCPNIMRSACVLDIAPVSYAHGHRDVFAAVNAVDLSKESSRQSVSDAMSGHIKDSAVRQFILTNLRRNEAGSYYWRIDFEALQRDYDNLAAAPLVGDVFTAPVLIIRGSESSYVLPEHEPEFRRRFNNCQFKSVEGVGHWLHAEKPELINTLIGRFLTQLT